MDFENIVKISFEKLHEEVWELRKELIFLKQELNELKAQKSQQSSEIKTNLISSGNRGVGSIFGLFVAQTKRLYIS